MRAAYKELTYLQKNQVKEVLLAYVFNAVLSVVALKVFIDAFGINGILYRDYLVCLAGLLLFVPKFMTWIKEHPRFSAEAYCIVDVLGILLILTYLTVLKEPWLIVLDATILTLGSLMISPQKSYVSGVVTNGCKEYSAYFSRTEAAGRVLFAVLGIMVTYNEVDLHVLTILAFMVRALQRIHTLRIVRRVYPKLNREEIAC